MNQLLKEVKEAGQDFEWYPTTPEIIRKVVTNISQHGSGYRSAPTILDVGAGDGRFLREAKKEMPSATCYGIEKSTILCRELAKHAFIIGADAMQQSYFTKTIDATFCNPPYKEYVDWSVKLIRETSIGNLFLVIPDRWKTNLEIQEALAYRGATGMSLGTFDFLNAERQARCTVEIVKIRFKSEENDAFKLFFEETFPDLRKEFEKEDKETSSRSDSFANLVPGESYVESIINLYNLDMEKVRGNYDRIAGLDIGLMKEFQVSPESIMVALREKLSSLRVAYWTELFSKMEKITTRLTSKRRRELLETLRKNVHVDFNHGNVLSVLIWIMENANNGIKDQLIEVYGRMISKANVVNYKSNKKVFVDNRWRYSDEKEPNSHYALERRIVLTGEGGIDRGWSGEKSEISERSSNFIKDLLTVAHTLGFAGEMNDPRLDRYAVWQSGTSEEFKGTFHGKEVTIFDVKAFFNGNLHVRMNQEFALVLNVEHGRLNGWIRTPKEAVDELGDKNASKYFDTTLKLEFSPFGLIGG